MREQTAGRIVVEVEPALAATWRSAVVLAATGLLAGAALVLLTALWLLCWAVHPALAVTVFAVIGWLLTRCGALWKSTPERG